MNISGEPVQAASLALYSDDVVGFCNPGCRDKFEKVVRHFEEVKASSVERARHAMSEQRRPLEEFASEFGARYGISR